MGADEVDAGIVERKRLIGVVGDDDADWQETVVGVVEPGIGLGVLDISGLGCDGDVVVTVVAGVFRGRQRRLNPAKPPAQGAYRDR